MKKPQNIIIAGLLSAKIDVDTFLNPIRTFVKGNGYSVMGEVIQRRGVSRSKKPGGVKRMNDPLNAKTYMGIGKIQELATEVEAKKPDYVLFFNELKKSQIERIETII